MLCCETRQVLTHAEGEQCETTGSYVRPGILERCEVTQKRVLPSELARCAVTGKRVLKRLLVTSTVSGARILEDVAVPSAAGGYCAPAETQPCFWSGRQVHPDDLRVCGLTGLPVHFEFIVTQTDPRLKPLVDLLDGTRRTEDATEVWATVAAKATSALASWWPCRVEAAVLSPDRRHLAVCARVGAWLGLREYHAGLVFSVDDRSIVGRVAHGRRAAGRWSEEEI